MSDKTKIRILLIEDDEDDYVIIKESLSEIRHGDFSLDWVTEIAKIGAKMKNQKYDICLMDYRLRGMTGIDLMKEMVKKDFDVPFIFLTGYGDHDTDVLAMKSGAADYLEKDKINPEMLERSIRYAIERKRDIKALRDSEHRLRILSAKLVEAQENERKRVAKELHDSIGSNLVAIKYGVESILVRMNQKKSYKDGLTMEQIVGYLKDTIEETQRISSDLRPAVLDDKGLGAAVKWICHRYQEIYPNIRFQLRLEPEEIEVSPSLKVTIFRVLQEAMNNIVKHSNADNVKLDINKNHEKISLIVSDNGKGFDTQLNEGEPKYGGVGLMGMRERIDLSGGFLNISSGKDLGCIINAVWSLNGVKTNNTPAKQAQKAKGSYVLEQEL